MDVKAIQVLYLVNSCSYMELSRLADCNLTTYSILYGAEGCTIHV